MSQASAPGRTRAPAARAEADPSGATRAARLADAALVAVFLALTFLLGAFPLKDTDFWWHLKAGDTIRQAGAVPTVDTFTYGAEGHRWVDLHWGFQVALSWGYEHVGVAGLTLAKCAITCLAVALLVTARRREWPAWPMLLAWLPALLVLGGRMYIRPETLTLLYLAADLAILARWDRRPALAFALPVVQVAWVNTQGLFLFGPILIAFALIDAATRRGAFAADRRKWWRAVLIASGLTGLACLANPYGLAGAIYPVQLAGTMSNPIFQRTIGELKPLPTFIDEVGLDNLPLQLHLATLALGGLSFLLPLTWSGWAGLRDRIPSAAPEARGGKAKVPKKKARGAAVDPPTAWRLAPFRLLLYGFFGALSLAATRNSHQFAAVVGTVTAWNFGEWAGAIRARRFRRDPKATAPRGWPRVVTLAALGLTIAAVASGRFYAWAGEGRTIGLGEEPLWFPHRAVEFAGGPGMPDRLLGYHNGHPSLYEYTWGPARKVYTDARLEVMGPELYDHYLNLRKRMGENEGNWAEELDEMGRPAVLVDNVDPGNADLAATLLNARRWRCVWFDPIASVFVHETLSQVVADHEVDFLARHFRREANTSTDDPATLAATAKALRNVGGLLRLRAGGEARGRSLLLLGLDYARRLRADDPAGLDGWKQGGLIEYIREPLMSEKPIPRFRLPFDPTFDLSPARATHDLVRTVEIAPDDSYVRRSLAKLYQMRGMDEAASPHLERFVALPSKNATHKRERALVADQVEALRSKLRANPITKWDNLSDLDRVVADLLAAGRAGTAADVIEGAYRPEARPWDWADRLALLRLHLGQPARARAAWLAANGALTPISLRSARIAATYFVEGDFDAAREGYREAIGSDPNLFEAHYGLALLEQDAGRAPEALAEARIAEKLAPNHNARAAARQVEATVAPYAATATSPR